MQRLEVALKQLEAEYNMYFAGRLPKPPWETRSRVAAIVKQYDRAYIQNYGDRFRFTTLQTRYHAFIDLWDKGLRAREEGRPGGPFAQKPKEQKGDARRAEDKVMHVTAFKDPLKEMDKLHDLYNSLVEARKEIGEDAVPFHKFADLVKTQVKKLTSEGHSEVAFRVAVKDGKVNFTARATKDGLE
jgi:hypothetical protein